MQTFELYATTLVVSLTYVLIIGTIIVVLLIVFLFLFVIIYQRKMIANQEEKRKMQTDKQQELLRAILATQESERKRLAEDLHDSVGQVLSAIKLNLHRLENFCTQDEKVSNLLSNTRNLVDESIQEIRSIIQNVRPPLLTDFGLQEALKDLCYKIQQNTGIEVNCKNDTGNERFSAEIEITLYRIIQELFGNTIKHAEAKNVQIYFHLEDGLIYLRYTDDGKGFDLKEEKNGSGLKNMESRASFIHGKINYQSAINKGIEVKISVPVKFDNQ